MSELGVLEPHDLSGYSRTRIPFLAPCPLCRAHEAIQTSTESLEVVGIGKVFVGYGYCGECGHIYQVMPVPENVLADYYRKFSNYTSQKPDVAKLLPPNAMSKRLLSITRDTVKSAGSIYEVGCATGLHLNHFRWAGWQVGGCDPSPKACAQAREVYGIDIECGLEADALAHQHNQDVILFSGVLEHLSDPVGALKRAHSALKYDGHVVLEVPCATSPESLPPGWFAFEHLQYFTPTAINQLLARSGFELIEARLSFRDFIYPVITAIAQRTEGKVAVPEGHRQASERLISTYIARDNSFWDRAAAKLDKIESAYYVWGAGIHTSQIIDRVPDCLERICRFIDTDPQKHGQFLAGKTVHAPAAYLCHRDLLPIVISSYAKEREIYHELLEHDVPEALIIRLYA